MRADPLKPLETRSEENGRVQIYTLPESAWPSERKKVVLPGRSDRTLLNGLDVLSITDFQVLRGKKFAYLTNATGLDRTLRSGLELMLKAGVRPEFLLEPEHGIFSQDDRPGPDGFRLDPETQMRIFSLYSTFRRPPEGLFNGLDIVVVDLQNLPVRCYTYVSTLTYVMEAATRSKVAVMVLDRPNPFGFMRAQGPYPNVEYRSFVGYAPVPYLYSLTLGEYAFFSASALFPDLRISVVRAAGFRREESDASIRLSWINPSPNIPTLESALIYTGVVFFEGTNVSLGRGTTRPFNYVGAPWMKSTEVVAELRKLALPGVAVTTVGFTPASSLYAGIPCRGVQLHPDGMEFDPIRTGYELMRIVRRIHPYVFGFNGGLGGYGTDRLWGGPGYRTAVQADLPYEVFQRTWARDSENFEEWVAPFRLY